MIFDVSKVANVGISHIIRKMVAKEDTAEYYGSHKLETLIASPVYVGMVIEACVSLVDDRLPPGLVTVGAKMELTHTAPASLGMYVSVKATVKDANGDRVIFEVEISDDAGVTGYGRHERVVVNKDKLIERARARLLHKT